MKGFLGKFRGSKPVARNPPLCGSRAPWFFHFPSFFLFYRHLWEIQNWFLGSKRGPTPIFFFTWAVESDYDVLPCVSIKKKKKTCCHAWGCKEGGGPLRTSCLFVKLVVAEISERIRFSPTFCMLMGEPWTMECHRSYILSNFQYSFWVLYICIREKKRGYKSISILLHRNWILWALTKLGEGKGKVDQLQMYVTC